ncbi:hypothetical protein K458DRAFT_382348 [Lentithecium fluviatile CBS 122367]|uniref:Uncharacterized protein n=1 Tax=Lentithecium fluviatile CBS 122367 TaxID=1168545 RepID=A0A6G1JKL6_9PLEO|nr:hypothetical protein K458DRAFT_382348 [Lentithecium fluviatile CBS 122367]
MTQARRAFLYLAPRVIAIVDSAVALRNGNLPWRATQLQDRIYPFSFVPQLESDLQYRLWHMQPNHTRFSRRNMKTPLLIPTVPGKQDLDQTARCVSAKKTNKSKTT